MAKVYRVLPNWFGFEGMALWPFILVSKDAVITKKLINHERIHLRQQAEMLVLPFYIWYGVEWLFRSLFAWRSSYYELSHEKEAYDNEDDAQYLDKRKLYNWIKYL